MSNDLETDGRYQMIEINTYAELVGAVRAILPKEISFSIEVVTQCTWFAHRDTRGLETQWRVIVHRAGVHFFEGPTPQDAWNAFTADRRNEDPETTSERVADIGELSEVAT